MGLKQMLNCTHIVFIAVIFNAFIDASSGQRQRQQLGFIGNRRESSCTKLNSPGKEYLLDQDSKRCYLLGARGPCGELMTFYRNPTTKDSKYGFCDCDQGNVDNEKPCKDSPIRRRVYLNADKRCYSVFSQGPCKRGEWLVLNEVKDSGVCIRNPCIKHGQSRETDDQFWFYDMKRLECYKSFTQGYCPQGMHLELVHDSQYPQCRAPTCSGSLAYGILSTVTLCQPGSRFSYLTRSCRGVYTRFRGIG